MDIIKEIAARSGEKYPLIQVIAEGFNPYFWDQKHLEVDYVVKSGKRLFAIEVKSARPRKLSGLNAFTGKFPEAIPVIVTPENFNSITKELV